jgi:ATP-dependent DNA helicase RecG
MKELSLHHNNTFRENYLYPAVNLGFVEMTIPDKPKSNLQKYRLTQKGLELKKQLSKINKKN